MKSIVEGKYIQKITRKKKSGNSFAFKGTTAQQIQTYIHPRYIITTKNYTKLQNNISASSKIQWEHLVSACDRNNKIFKYERKTCADIWIWI